MRRRSTDDRYNDDDGGFGQEYQDLYAEVTRIFVEHAEQWCTFSTFIPDYPSIHLLDNATGRLPILIAVEIIHSPPPYRSGKLDFSVFRDAPNLRHLVLPENILEEVVMGFPWHQIENFRFRWQNIDVWLHIIEGARNLRKLTGQLLDTSEPAPSNYTVYDVVLPYLLDLDIFFRTVQDWARLMNSITAPFLQDLTIYLYPKLGRGIILDPVVLTNFVIRSVCGNTLTTVSIGGLGFAAAGDEVHMLNFLEQLPALVTLTIGELSIGRTAGMSDELILRMYPSESWRKKGSKDFLLPKLRKFTYDSSYGRFTPEILLDMLEFRWWKTWKEVSYEDNIAQITYVSVDMGKGFWDPEEVDYSCKQAFLRMERAGLELNLTTDFQQERWLPPA